ncbi:hypothetical protein JCM30237_29730 [Halolamina litorea]|uniref:Uncharacterized protein n=1 Tax=Halolamina litorea TaxID=1515593 RepID=A0ABD6BT78_9EURY|nr:hypothetical protein [Halolamina litorea]
MSEHDDPRGGDGNGGEEPSDLPGDDERWEPVGNGESADTPDSSTERASAEADPDPLATSNGESSVPEAVQNVGRMVKRFLQVLARIAFAGFVALLGKARDTDREDPLQHWLLLSGNRWTVIWTMTVSFFLLSLALGATDVIGISQADFVVEMFSTIIAGLFSFTPVVVGVNSLSMTGLSSSLGGIEQRIESVEEFRSEVADLSPRTVVTPTDPAGFIDVATDTLHDRIGSLRAGVDAIDEPAKSDIEAVANDAESAIADVERAVEGDPSIIDVLVPMMDDDYSRDINRLQQLRRVYTEIPAETRQDLADMQDLLESLDVTRAYFKTMYLQQELAAFSRYIAYAGINALLWSMFIIMVFANGRPDVSYGTEIVVLVSVGMTAAFFAFSVLFSYILRIATVIKRTSAPGAFTPQKGN